MQIEPTRLFRPKAVAEILSVSTATVYREIEAGRLAAVRFGSGRGSFRVSGDAIITYLEKARARPVGPSGDVAGEDATVRSWD